MATRRTAEQTRAAIVQAVVDLTAESSPDELTTRAIAQRAGVQQSVIYRHFGSRQALLDEATREFMRATVRLLGQGLDIEQSLRAGYEHLRAQPGLALRVARAVASGQASELLAAEPTDETRMGNLLLLQLAVRRRSTPDDPVTHADLIVLQCLVGGAALLLPYFVQAPVGADVDPDLVEERLHDALAALVAGVERRSGDPAP